MESINKNIFTYGTLTYRQVMLTVVSKEYQSVPGTLQGYLRRQIKNRWSPGIKPQQGSSVQGLLYLDVSPEDVQKLHKFQGCHEDPPRFTHKEVTIQTEKGDIPSLVYIYGNPSNLHDYEWDIKNFQETKYKEFLQIFSKQQQK